MSSARSRFHELIDSAKNEVGKIFGRGHATAEAAVAKLDEVKAAVEADVPPLEHEAAQDADELGHDTEAAVETAAHDAEHEFEPVTTEAEHDAQALTELAGRDAAAIAEADEKAQPVMGAATPVVDEPEA